MPVRKVSNRGGNIIGHFPSLKLQRMVEFESLIERDFIYLLDFEKAIVAFAEQPFIIPYLFEGKKHTYTPDFFVQFADTATAVIECKPQQFVSSDENQRKFTAARQWCAEAGHRFGVITDKLLQSNYRVQNVKLLTQHARHVVNPLILRQITSLLTTAPATVGQLMGMMNPQNPTAVISPLLYMAFHHDIFIPLNDAPIHPETAVTLFNSHQEAYYHEYTTIFGREAISLAEHHLRGTAALTRQLPED